MGVAVAFILHDEHGHTEDSALYLVDTVGLNRVSGRDDIINVPEDKNNEYQSIYWDFRPIRIEKPLAIRPDMITECVADPPTHSAPPLSNSATIGAASKCVWVCNGYVKKKASRRKPVKP